MMSPTPGLRSQTLNGPPSGPGLAADEFFTAERGPDRILSATFFCSGVSSSRGISLNRRGSAAGLLSGLVMVIPCLENRKLAQRGQSLPAGTPPARNG